MESSVKNEVFEKVIENYLRGYSVRMLYEEYKLKESDIAKILFAGVMSGKLNPGLCEYCGKENNYSCASGRYCSRACSATGSTKKSHELKISDEELIKVSGNFSNKTELLKSFGIERASRELNERLKTLELKFDTYENNLTKELLNYAINNSKTLNEFYKNINANYLDYGKYKKAKIKASEYGLVIPTFKIIQNNSRDKNSNYINNSDYFVKDSIRNRGQLKKRMLELGIENKCSIDGCQLNKESNSLWLNKAITLQLDHINGNNTDNRLENLRLICPNCHSQTETFAGRNVKRIKDEAIINGSFIEYNKRKEKVIKNNLCNNCNNKEISNKRYKLCEDCDKNRIEQIKEKRANRYGVNYPNFNELKRLIEDNGYVKAGKLIGVSDKALKKHVVKILPEDESIPKYITREQRRKDSKNLINK